MGNTDWMMLVPGWENQQDVNEYGIPNGARPLAMDNPFRIGTAYSTKMPTWFTAEQQRQAAYKGDAYTTNAQGDQVFAVPYIQGDESNISAGSLNPGAPAPTATADYAPQIGDILDPSKLKNARGVSSFNYDLGRDVQTWDTDRMQYTIGTDGHIENIVDNFARRQADLARRNAEFEGQNNAAIQRTIEMNRATANYNDPHHGENVSTPNYWDPNGGNQQFTASNRS